MHSANTNAVVSAFWCTLEIFRDPQLLRDVRKKVESCLADGNPSRISFDLNRLLRQPLLQAVYAETLRLRVNGFLVRCPLKSDLEIHDYVIPRNHFVLTNSTPGHMDPKMWCTGQNAAHPPDQFWPGRFLRMSPSKSTLEFSTAGTEEVWMPFRGGTHICPRKKFAKLELILTMALMAEMYNIKILAKGKDIKISTRNFGFSTLSTCGKIPVQIRK